MYDRSYASCQVVVRVHCVGRQAQPDEKDDAALSLTILSVEQS